MAENQRNIRKIAPIAALALAGVAAVAFAAGVASHGPLALAADPSAAASAAANQPGTGIQGGWMHMGGMHMGRGLKGGPGAGVSITVTAISGTKLSLQTTDGWTRTIDATGATVTKGGQTAALSDVKVGDTINFRESRQSDGTYKITAIEIVLPEISGTVSSVNGNSISIKQFDGSSKTITVNGSTTYVLAGKGTNGTASKNDVVAGANIDAVGTVDSSGNFTATTVRIAPAAVSGTVASKTATSIIVTTPDGKSVTVKVSSSTSFRVAGQTSPTLANVAVGDRIVAEGTLNSDGSLSASAVTAGANDQPGFGGWGMGRGHMGGFGGFGPGMMPGAAPSSSPTANQ